jgi:ribosome-associated protein
LRSLGAGRIDAEGRIVVVSQLTRSRERNLKDAREKLAELVRRALIVPKSRKPTRPSGAERRRRLEGKRRQSEKKRARARTSHDD